MRPSLPWSKLSPWVTTPRPSPCSQDVASGWSTIPNPGGVVQGVLTEEEFAAQKAKILGE